MQNIFKNLSGTVRWRDFVFQIVVCLGLWFVMTSASFVIGRETHVFLSGHKGLHHFLIHGVFGAMVLLSAWRYFWDTESFWQLEPFALLKKIYGLPPHISLVCLYAAYACLQWLSLVFMHEGMGTSLWDLGFNDQVIWGTAHGRFLTLAVRGGYSALGEHFTPIFAVLAPVYWVSNQTELLFAVQCLMIAGCIPLTYAIARQTGVTHATALTLAAAVFFYQPMRYGILFPFQAQTFADPFLLFGFYLLLRSRLAFGLSALLLALMCKENIVMETAGIGFFLLFLRRKAGLGVLALALFILILNTKILEPYFQFDYKWNKWGYFSHITDPSWEAWRNLWSGAFGPKLWWFLALVFMPFLFLPFMAQGWYCLLGPTLALRILSSFHGFRIITAHYTSGLNALIFLGAVYAAARLEAGNMPWLLRSFKDGKKQERLRRFLNPCLLIAGIFFSGLPQFFLFENFTWEASSDENQRIAGILESVPESYSVISTQTFLPHIAHRHHIFGYDTVGAGAPLASEYRQADLLVVDEGRLQVNERRAMEEFRVRNYQELFRYTFLTIYARPDLPQDDRNRLITRWYDISKRETIPYRKIIRYFYKRILIVVSILFLWGLWRASGRAAAMGEKAS